MIENNLFYFIDFKLRRQNLVRTLLILIISFDIYISGTCFKIIISVHVFIIDEYPSMKQDSVISESEP